MEDRAADSGGLGAQDRLAYRSRAALEKASSTLAVDIRIL